MAIINNSLTIHEWEQYRSGLRVSLITTHKDTPRVKEDVFLKVSKQYDPHNKYPTLKMYITNFLSLNTFLANTNLYVMELKFRT